jgi:glycosyltransferase involved in cell wall biosynthesis
MDLSVIIPTRNRVRHLRELLTALSQQVEPPFSWEIIIVDNGSEDDTHAVALEKLKSVVLNMTYIYEPKPGLHNGRHRGALAAKGEYVAFLDDDVLPEPHWILSLQSMIDYKAQAMGGPVLPLYSSPPPDWIESFWISCPNGKYCFPLSLIDLGAESIIPVSPYFIFGCNLFILKKTLFDVGGFHPDAMPRDLIRFRGDGETGLMLHFLNSDLVCMHEPKAVVRHVIESDRLTIDYFSYRYYIQGISDSFTHIRKNGGPTAAQTHFRIPPHTDPRHLPLWHKMAQAYLDGWQYHYSEVQNDPALLAHVLQPSYWSH